MLYMLPLRVQLVLFVRHRLPACDTVKTHTPYSRLQLRSPAYRSILLPEALLVSLKWALYFNALSMLTRLIPIAHAFIAFDSFPQTLGRHEVESSLRLPPCQVHQAKEDQAQAQEGRASDGSCLKPEVPEPNGLGFRV